MKELNILPHANEVKNWLSNMKDLVELEEKNNPLIGYRIYSLGHTYLFAKKAIKDGYDVNSQEMKSGNTPLHFALEWYDNSAYHRILETIELLIENGANINIKNSKGITALQMAIKKGLTLTGRGQPR